jgi:hypothetical protein
MWRLLNRLPRRIKRLFDIRLGYLGSAASSAKPWRRD